MNPFKAKLKGKIIRVADKYVAIIVSNGTQSAIGVKDGHQWYVSKDHPLPEYVYKYCLHNSLLEAEITYGKYGNSGIVVKEYY